MHTNIVLTKKNPTGQQFALLGNYTSPERAPPPSAFSSSLYHKCLHHELFPYGYIFLVTYGEILRVGSKLLFCCPVLLTTPKKAVLGIMGPSGTNVMWDGG